MPCHSEAAQSLFVPLSTDGEIEFIFSAKDKAGLQAQAGPFLCDQRDTPLRAPHTRTSLLPQRKCCQLASGSPGPNKAGAALCQGLGTATSSLVVRKKLKSEGRCRPALELALGVSGWTEEYVSQNKI